VRGARARLDVADLVVIAARVLGIGTDAVLAQMDVAAARDALAEAALGRTALAQASLAGAAPTRATAARTILTGAGRPAGVFRDRAGAAAAGVGVVHALLRHRPFPRHCQQVAVAAGLQFLSLNGWHADLNPPAPAAVVIEALASGQLAPDAAAAWLSSRLTPVRHEALRRIHLAPVPRRLAAPRRPAPVPRRPMAATRSGGARSAGRTSVRRALASALLALAVGSVSLLAAACSRGGDAPATPAIHPPATTAPAHTGHGGQVLSGSGR
jgi:hypothetical protein